MKFFLACLAWLVMAVALGWGMLLAVNGKPILLIAAIAGFIIAVGRIGCLPPAHH